LAIAGSPPTDASKHHHRSLFNSRREEIIEKQYEELKELETRYRSLYENAPAMLRTINREGIILDCNSTYAKNLGYDSKSEIIGHSIFDHTPEEYMAEKRKAFEEWRSTGNVKSHETWIKRKDGSSFPVLLNANNLYDAKGNFIGSNTVITDLTEICEARRLKEKAAEEIRKALDMKQEFLNIAAHELRTPIQPILGYAELLEKGALNIGAVVKGIRDSAIRLRELANDILDVTTIESGQLKYNKQRVRANSLVNKLVSYADITIQSFGKTRDILVVVPVNSDGYGGGSDIELLVDEKRMMQALQNVVGNAIKFTEKGHVKIESTLLASKGLYQIEISDTGCGIPAEILPKLFDKFASKTDKDHLTSKGTGLGLFIAKTIIQAHGGDIVGFNNNGEKGGPGATFLIRLPIAPVATRAA
jgi:PAS domain S-box-containing protein